MSETEQGQYSVGEIDVGMLTGVRDHFTGPNGEWLESSEVVARLNDLQAQLTAAEQRAEALAKLHGCECVETDLETRVAWMEGQYLAAREAAAELALLRPRAALLDDVAFCLKAWAIGGHKEAQDPRMYDGGLKVIARYDALPAAPVQADAVTIPEMTDKLSSYWKQPAVSDILLTAETATMSKATFDKLANYEHTIPTGVYAGKMWRAGETFCWYGEIENGECSIHRRRICGVTADATVTG